jgi:hypothetical protein
MILPLLASAAEKPRAKEQSEKALIDAHDLNARYEVRGPLGVSLGKVVTVKCKRVDSRMKDQPDSLEVTVVDGTPLKMAVTLAYSPLPWNPVKLEMNREYELRVYQTGGFDGIPGEAMKETSVVQTRRYGFRVHLVVVKPVKLLPLQNDESPR